MDPTLLVEAYMVRSRTYFTFSINNKVMDPSKLSFAERIKLKQSSGFDNKVKENLLELKERRFEVEKHKTDYKPAPKMPK